MHGGGIKDAVREPAKLGREDESSWGGGSVDREALYIHFTLSYSHTLD